MSQDANIAAQENLGDNINAGDVDAAVQSFAEDAVDHDPAPGRGPGREGFKSFFETLAAAFPDAHIEPAHMAADDEHVSIAYTLTGNHQGTSRACHPAASDRGARGVQIARFRDGKIVERWGSSDELGIMRQIGATPKSPGLLDKLGLK